MRQPLHVAQVTENKTNSTEIISFDYVSLRTRRIITEIKRVKETTNTNALAALDLLEYFYQDHNAFLSTNFPVILRNIAVNHYFNLQGSLDHLAIFESAKYIILLIKRIINTLSTLDISELEGIDLDDIREILTKFSIAFELKDEEMLEDVKFDIESLGFVQRKAVEILLFRLELEA